MSVNPSSCAVLCAGLLACASSLAAPAADVDAARLKNAAAEPQNWFTGGRDNDQSYYSPLDKVNAQSIDKLGFAWAYDLGQPQRGQEATPIVVDGIMYTSGTWGFVYALDAATGRELWRYDPKAEPFMARNPCCDMVNRGVAVWKGKVYVASVDGRLHALDAATGKKLWEADTLIDHKAPYSSSGAPIVAGGVVVIGNSGADMGRGAVRGYVTAYDAATGAQKWRFFTVPGPVGAAYEHPEMATADKTWDSHRGAEFKGGATVWNAFSYDPELNLLYFGTANAAPYDLRQLGEEKNKDLLFAATILALDASTGRMAWYYQTTPRDMWDFDAVQNLHFADLTINGEPRKVIMQANKNGFFYVLDRKSGQLISADKFAFTNWASHIDMKTGRPVLQSNADWHASPKIVYPAWYGAHTWNPDSYDPQTHLVYIPVVDAPAIWVDLAHNGGPVKYLEGFFTADGIIPDDTYDSKDASRLFGPVPSEKDVKALRHVKAVRELIKAYDPVAQKVVWEHETSSGIRGYDGGVLSTAGNLVFQGRGNGQLVIYAADSGKLLRTIETYSHIMAAPMSYAINGEQYVAVQAGYGGTGISVGPTPPSSAAYKYENLNRLIAFKLGGGAVPKPGPRIDPPFEKPPEQKAGKEQIAAGELVFVTQCSRCHQLGPSITPDLRKLNEGLHLQFKDILLRGLLAPAGMEKFSDVLSEQDADNVHAYLIDQAWTGYRAQQAAGAKKTGH